MRSYATNLVGLIALMTGAALLVSHPPATAAEYPSQAINLYIGSAPAGSTDVLGRVLARSLEAILGEPVVVHNTPGAGGAVMATQLMRSAPDGYSLGMAISHAYSGNPVVLPSTTEYTVADFTHLAAVSKGQCALVTNSSTPYTTFEDVVQAARRGEEPVFASQSPLTRVLADYLAKVAEVNFKIITVQGGGEMMQTILGGHADFGFSGGPHVDYAAAGQMRVLASTEEMRLATSPSVPTLRELGYNISSCALFVVSAPPGLPDEIKQQLSAALARAIPSPEMRALLQNLKYPEYYLGPDEVLQALVEETDILTQAVALIDTMASNQPNGDLSLFFMPYVAVALGVIAMILMLAARILHGRNNSESSLLPLASWVSIGTATAVLSVTLALMNFYGYLAGATTIVAGFMLMARARIWVVLGTAIALPVGLWLLFEKLLGFPLP